MWRAVDVKNLFNGTLYSLTYGLSFLFATASICTVNRHHRGSVPSLSSHALADRWRLSPIVLKVARVTGAAFSKHKSIFVRRSIPTPTESTVDVCDAGRLCRRQLMEILGWEIHISKCALSFWYRRTFQ